MKRNSMIVLAIFASLIGAVFALPMTVTAKTVQGQDPMVLGKLYFVNLKQGEQPVMTGLSLHGNVCGSGDFNNKPAATEGIRAVFELNEWIEFYPQASVGAGIKVMVFNTRPTKLFTWRTHWTMKPQAIFKNVT